MSTPKPEHLADAKRLVRSSREPRHTPGPWYKHDGAVEVYCYGKRIAVMDTAPNTGTSQERTANARLMAAAWLLPEVREVLDALGSAMYDEECNHAGACLLCNEDAPEHEDGCPAGAAWALLARLDEALASSACDVDGTSTAHVDEALGGEQ